MSPRAAFFSDAGIRGLFICRPCLAGLQAARRGLPTRPRWPAATATTAAAATTRTATSQAMAVRGRAKRIDALMKQHQTRMDEGRKAQSRPGTRPAAAGGGSGRLGRTAAAPRQKPQLGNRAAAEASLEEKNRATLAQAGDQTGTTGDDNVTIRYFHQDAGGQIYPSYKDKDGFDSSAEDQLLKAQLEELEDKLQETMQLVERLEQNQAGKQRADQLREKYGVLAVDEAAAEDDDALDPAAAVRIGMAGLSVHARRHVRNLNSTLRTAARQLHGRRRQTAAAAVDTRLITALWKRYGAARTALAEDWTNMPAAAWACLWTVLAGEDKKDKTVNKNRNPNRMAHVYYLAKDMQAAGVALTDAQQLVALEAMFAEGWPAAAVDNWRRAAGTLGTRPDTATAYWELGLRMCARTGDFERAERAADLLFGEGEGEGGERSSHKDADPRVLLELIRCNVARNQKDKAWTAYRRLRALLEAENEKTASSSAGAANGDKTPTAGMTMEDYDVVVSCFLSAKETKYAFDVFVDMMFSGALDVHRARRAGGPAHGLPSAVANHFFFGKWLKRLIGAGDLDGAYRVLVFMQGHDILPAAVQVNGLLGAWMRSGVAANQARADRLAWQMIDARRRFVDLRRRSVATGWTLQLHVARPARTDEGKEDDDTFTYVPRASLETFLLVAESYKNRGLVGPLEELWEAFRASEMVASADAFMMDQLLESYVRDGRSPDAHALYARLVHGPPQVVPSVHTFLALFRSLQRPAAVDDVQRAADGRTCRQLIADLARLPPGARRGPGGPADADDNGGLAAAKHDPVLERDVGIRHALGRLVLHAFRRSGDYVGFIVALRVLRPLLGGRFAVSDSLAVELVAEADAELGRDLAAARRRVFKASEVVEALLRERVRAREQQQQTGGSGGGGPVALTAADLSDDLAAAVAHVYRRKCTGISDAAFQELYADAVKDMRVEAFL